jgi:hypothetical protein
VHQAVAEILLPEGSAVGQPGILQDAEYRIPGKSPMILASPPAEGGGKRAVT